MRTHSRSIFAALLLALVVTGSAGCTPNKEQIADLKSAYAETAVLVEQLDADLEVLEADSTAAASVRAALVIARGKMELIEENVAKLEAGNLFWLDLAEIAAIVGASFLGGGGLIAVPFIRAAKAVTKAVFKSIDAGDGPSSPAAAKKVLLKTPKAYAAFKAYKAKRDA